MRSMPRLGNTEEGGDACHLIGQLMHVNGGDYLA
jgi:hypothetical protein